MSLNVSQMRCRLQWQLTRYPLLPSAEQRTLTKGIGGSNPSLSANPQLSQTATPVAVALLTPRS